MGLFIAACVTTALALCGVAMLMRRARNRRQVALAFMLALPLQPLVFYALRQPLDAVLGAVGGTIVMASLLYAPLTEEPAKWLTATVPAIRSAILDDPIVVALAVGVGFGVGEIWFLANALIRSPQYPDLPFWMFSGFLIERLAVCFLHGVFVVPAFYALACGRSFALGGGVGVVLHFLLNLPIFLAQIGAFGFAGRTWHLVLVSWIFWCVLGGVGLVVILAGRFGRRADAVRHNEPPPP